MDRRNKRLVIIAVAALAVGISIVAVLWRSRVPTSDLLDLLENRNTALRVKGAELLLARLEAGKLDAPSAEKALDIISCHIAPHTRATQAKRPLPQIWAEEINLGHAIAKNGMASQQAKARFFHALECPWAEYVTHPGGQCIDVHGSGRVTSGMVLRRELVITAVDRKEVADKVLDDYWTAGTPGAGVLSWGSSAPLESRLKPTNSITAKLMTSWYSVPPDIAAELPESGKNPEHIQQLEKVLKMDSTQHLCTCSRSVALSKKSEWKAHFPDYPEPAYRLSIEGRIRFNARPIADYTSGKPKISFNNRDSGRKGIAARVDYDEGAFRVYGLGAANYVMFVSIDANTANPGGSPGYPGDFSSDPLKVSVPDSGAAEVKVDMQKVIHLISPQDNEEKMPLWGEPVDRKITFNSPVTFAWDSLGDGVQYHYKICRQQAEPYRFLQTVAEKSPFGGTSVSVTLPASRPNEYYKFTLSATIGRRQVGKLITNGRHGHGWDFRFRVE